jgi:hypothetical protein
MRYSVTPHPIQTILTWVSSGEIAIPEIQRPFVWEAVKVRNLLDSLYQGYPVGYPIAWRNPNVRLKDGTVSAGKRILIDGQQRVTALMAALLGQEVLTADYDTVRMRIAFHPIEEKFEVQNTAILRDPAWLPDVAALFKTSASMLGTVRAYGERNEGVDEDRLYGNLERLKRITGNQVGVIELAEDLDIETVTEIFIRVNSAGVTLSQADFAMSKIAANTTYGGPELRKAIDYFCHLAVAPDHAGKIEKNDTAFAASAYWPRIKWLADANDDLYDPSYTDMLRVAFTSRFGRGRLEDLVALLSGRNFETKRFEDAIAEQSFATLKEGVLDFVNETHFKRLTMILRSAGIVVNRLIGSQNAVNFAYILYLSGRVEKVEPAVLERLVRRWYAMSALTQRYTNAPENQFDFDIRQLAQQGLETYADLVLSTTMAESFWTGMLPLQMDTSSTNSPYFQVYRAAQAKLGDKGFLSRDITVRDLLLNRSDVHHVFPRNLLKRQGLARGRYNQIANFVIAQSEINIAIGDKPPAEVFAALHEQVHGGPRKYGGITDPDELRLNLEQNCIPPSMLEGEQLAYEDFLAERRRLMAERIRVWFEGL